VGDGAVLIGTAPAQAPAGPAPPPWVYRERVVGDMSKDFMDMGRSSAQVNAWPCSWGAGRSTSAPIPMAYQESRAYSPQTASGYTWPVQALGDWAAAASRSWRRRVLHSAQATCSPPGPGTARAGDQAARGPPRRRGDSRARASARPVRGSKLFLRSGGRGLSSSPLSTPAVRGPLRDAWWCPAWQSSTCRQAGSPPLWNVIGTDAVASTERTAFDVGGRLPGQAHVGTLLASWLVAVVSRSCTGATTRPLVPVPGRPVPAPQRPEARGQLVGRARTPA
jgi:hypothetical protein